MDGMHDLGGRQGFGAVRYTHNAPAFHAAWEVRANSLYAFAVRLRHLQHGRVPARDRAHGAAALPHRQLLRTFAHRPGDTTASRKVSSRARNSSGGRRGAFRSRRRAHRDAATRRRASVSSPAIASASSPTTCRVMCACRATFAARRVPWSASPRPILFPTRTRTRVQSEDEPTYDVRFRSEDLWPNSADTALVHAGVFQSYLERVG